MGTTRPSQIPFPLSSFPGANPQEGAGRLINCTAEPLGEPGHPSGPSPQVWRRQPGLSQFTTTAQSGYRGGLLVNNLAYEVFANNVTTVDATGQTVTSLGSFPGTKKVSIARNQAASPNVVGVDLDNGAYNLATGGAPTLYNGGGNLPQPNSVCFQDGYFFFTIGDGRCFASGINALTQNALTFINVTSKADVLLLRGIAYSSLLWLFTTGNCELWQDTAQPTPGFPYSRQISIEYGLVQANAIAGWETGFSNLMWVAQDFAVYLAVPGSISPVKVSPPDLDRLIEAEVRAGDTLEASCYAFAGKKFWVLSSPNWTWEFNINTQKWSERQSLSSGLFGRWRATGGHPAFGKWIVGDTQSGNLLWVDKTNYTENGAVQLFRAESGPVKNFPNQLRIARADFDFDMGVGVQAGLPVAVTNATNNGSGAIRLTLATTSGLYTDQSGTVQVAGVGGTTEANGSWSITVINTVQVDLVGSSFSNAYTSGGTLTQTPRANDSAPSVAISRSKDGGLNWGNPLVRSLGAGGRALRQRASVKNMGQSGPMGARWRVDITDNVYAGLLAATMSSDPREVGA